MGYQCVVRMVGIAFILLLLPNVAGSDRRIRECFRRSFEEYNGGTLAPLTKTTRKPNENENEKENIVPAPANNLINNVNEVARKKAAVAYCKNINATIAADGSACILITRHLNETHVCVTKEMKKIIVINTTEIVNSSHMVTLSIVGNTVGSLFLFGLIATYSCFKDLQTSYGKYIIMLSVLILFKNIQYSTSYYVYTNPVACKLVAITSHWSLLAMFSWTACMAYDLLRTFSRVRVPSPAIQKRRFKLNTVLCLGTSTGLCLMCLVLDLASNGRYIGYGVTGMCFVSNPWANLICFVVPVGLALIFNFACLCGTIYFIANARNRSKALFPRGKNSRAMPEASLTIMAMKLSLVLGLSWVIGYIGGILQNTELLYIFLFFDSFHGMFLYFAFCCNGRVCSFYKEKFVHSKLRIGTLSTTRSGEGLYTKETTV
eukprot:gene16306-7692_t